jgi:hypothetical protein
LAASRVGWRKASDEKPGSLMEKRMENARVCLSQGADAVRTAGETAKRPIGNWIFRGIVGVPGELALAGLPREALA